MKKKHEIMTRIPPELFKLIKKRAEKEGRSYNNLVNFILRKELLKED